MLYNKRKRIINEDENVINPSADKEYTLFSSPGTYINDTDDINGEESLFEPFYKPNEKEPKNGHVNYNNKNKNDFIKQGKDDIYIKADFMGQERYFPVTTAGALKMKIDNYLKNNNFQINTFSEKTPEDKKLLGIHDIYNYFNEGNMNTWIITKTASDAFFKDNETYKGIGKATFNLGNLLEYFFGKMPDNQSLADFNGGDLKTYRFNAEKIDLFSQVPESGLIFKDVSGRKITDKEEIEKLKKQYKDLFKNDDDGQITNNIDSSRGKDNKVPYEILNKTIASVEFEKDENGISHPSKIVLKTYLDAIEGNYYIETVYNAQKINQNLQNNTPREFNKFTKTIKDKISGLLQVDSIRMHLTEGIKFPGVDYTIKALFGFPRCHIHYMISDGIIATNFINAINQNKITIDFTLKESNVSARFLIENTLDSWMTLYDVNYSTAIIPGETTIETIDNNKQTEILSQDKNNQNEIMSENVIIKKINENTLNLIIKNTIKSLLREAKLNEQYDWDENGKCIKFRYDGPDGDEIYDFPAGNIDPKTGKFLDIIAAGKAGLIKDPQEMEEYKAALRQLFKSQPKPVNTSTSSKLPKMLKEEYNKFYPDDYAKAMHSMYINYVKLSKKKKNGGLSDKESLTLADLQHSLSKDGWFYKEKQIRKQRMSL